MTSRVIYCPACGRRYTVAEATLAERELLVLCGSCEATFKASEVRTEPPRRPDPGVELRSVLIAHEAPSVCNTVGRVVREAGFTPRFAHDGEAAVAAFDDTLPDTPRALVLDVGIPVLHSFDVISALRQQERHETLPIVLVASVFDPTRYKRRPSSLHGADAYLELHHIPDRLPSILQARVNGKGEISSEHRGHMPHERAQAEALRVGTTLEASAIAQIVARRIVSDIALYNEDEILEGLNNGDLDKRLSAVFDEGRRMFESSVADIERISGDPFEEAKQELIDVIRRRAQL